MRYFFQGCKIIMVLTLTCLLTTGCMLNSDNKDSGPKEGHRKIVGLCDTGPVNADGGYGLYVQDNYAYLADLDNYLATINITNPHNPSSIGFYIDSCSAVSVFLNNNKIYILDRGCQLRIYGNVSNGPAQLQLLSSSFSNYPGSFYITWESASFNVCASGNYAYLAHISDKLIVVNVSNPLHPSWSTVTSNLHRTEGVFVKGSYLYVADGPNGLAIFDIATTPGFPIFKGAVDTPGEAHKVYVEGNYAYVADREGGLQIINVTNPSHPTIISSVDTPGSAYDVFIRGNGAYVADYSAGLLVINIVDRTQPRIIDTVPISNHATCVFVSDSHIYVASSSNGLNVVDFNP
jgi:hypothetical protein